MADSALLGGGIWLFNLTADPNERLNIAASNPAVVQKMRARLAELADPKNGYKNPQTNIPSPLSLPVLHNGTWEPWKKSVVGEEHERRMSLKEAEGATEALTTGSFS